MQTESRTGDAGTRAIRWPGFFRAVAVDFDGTLTESGYPDPGVLAALDQVRAGGLRVVIVTGRILAELEAVFPDAGEHADLIIAENGGVLARGAGAGAWPRRCPPAWPRRCPAGGWPAAAVRCCWRAAVPMSMWCWPKCAGWAWNAS